jgi:RNA-binding protein Tab2/Atab2
MNCACVQPTVIASWRTRPGVAVSWPALPRQSPRRHAGARRTRLIIAHAAASDAAAVQEAASTSAAAAVPGPALSDGAEYDSEAAPTSDVLELDFCSRPLLDERGKKVWELLICSPDRSFVHSQYFPNSKINSVEVRGHAAHQITTCAIYCDAFAFM